MRRSAAARTVVALFVFALATSARGQEDTRVHVRIGRFHDQQAVVRAARGVLERLGGDECRGVLRDFTDAEGRTLEQNLTGLGLSAEDYLGWVFFYDGFGQGRCMQKGIYAITQPGSRLVSMCGPRFTELSAREPQVAQAVVLHEVLHTLGLQENPPSSAHITQRVLERCYPEVLAGFGKPRPRGAPVVSR